MKESFKVIWQCVEEASKEIRVLSVEEMIGVEFVFLSQMKLKK